MTDEKMQHKVLARVRKMMKLAQDAGATEGERDNAMRMVHATAFAQSAAEKIRQRCYEIEQAAKTKGVEDVVSDEPAQLTRTPGTALVLASLYQTEKEANDKAMKQLEPNLGTGRSQTYAEGMHARRAGAEFGSKVSLHRQVKKEDK